MKRPECNCGGYPRKMVALYVKKGWRYYRMAWFCENCHKAVLRSTDETFVAEYAPNRKVKVM